MQFSVLRVLFQVICSTFMSTLNRVRSFTHHLTSFYQFIHLEQKVKVSPALPGIV
jgi:hypothetical protein